MERAKRFNTKEITAVEIYGRQGAEVVNMINLSSTGACLRWNEDSVRLKKGDLVRLTIVLNSINKRRQVNGEVVWSKDKATGVMFLTEDQVFERLIEKSL